MAQVRDIAFGEGHIQQRGIGVASLLEEVLAICRANRNGVERQRRGAVVPEPFSHPTAMLQVLPPLADLALQQHHASAVASLADKERLQELASAFILGGGIIDDDEQRHPAVERRLQFLLLRLVDTILHETGDPALGCQ